MSASRWIAVVMSVLLTALVVTFIITAALSHLDGKGRHRKANGDGDQSCHQTEAHDNN